VPGESEVRYPGERSFRADWAVGEYFIECLGLAEDPEYDANTLAQTQTVNLSFRLQLGGGPYIPISPLQIR
jgi:hypothetical protein